MKFGDGLLAVVGVIVVVALLLLTLATPLPALDPVKSQSYVLPGQSQCCCCQCDCCTE